MDISRIFEISSEQEFRSLALEVFEFQYRLNPVYHRFCKYLQVSPDQVNSITDIPFLPIELFKTSKVLANGFETETSFSSSGTTGPNVSKHYIADLDLYKRSFRTTFGKFYGDIGQYSVLALLPSYLERSDSSLIYMVSDLIEQSRSPESGFYLDDFKALADQLKELDEAGKPILLIGVTFALLDLAESYDLSLSNAIVMETGGMKGRKEEMIRAQVHQVLKDAWGIKQVHSEYGMTELLSQAYAVEDGIFHGPEWMQVLIRDTEDPKSYLAAGSTGGINVIDLANIYSCSFIATQDLGKSYANGGFEVLGRFDHSDIRGCNLMVV